MHEDKSGKISLTILRKIDEFFYHLFFFYGIISLLIAIPRNHPFFLLTATLSMVYHFIIHDLVLEHVQLRYCSMLHIYAFLFITSFFIMAFGYYLEGMAMLIVVGMASTFVLLFLLWYKIDIFRCLEEDEARLYMETQ